MRLNSKPDLESYQSHEYSALGWFVKIIILSTLAIAGYFYYENYYPERSDLHGIRMLFKDPDSVKFKDISRKGSATCGMVIGKNSYGANTGYKKFYYLESINSLTMEGTEMFDLTYKIYCIE